MKKNGFVLGVATGGLAVAAGFLSFNPPAFLRTTLHALDASTSSVSSSLKDVFLDDSVDSPGSAKWVENRREEMWIGHRRFFHIPEGDKTTIDDRDVVAVEPLGNNEFIAVGVTYTPHFMFGPYGGLGTSFYKIKPVATLITDAEATSTLTVDQRKSLIAKVAAAEKVTPFGPDVPLSPRQLANLWNMQVPTSNEIPLPNKDSVRLLPLPIGLDKPLKEISR